MADNSIDQAKLVLDIYDYALSHDLDISSPEDVRSILESLKITDIDDERFWRIMTALQVTDRKIKKDVSRRRNVN